MLRPAHLGHELPLRGSDAFQDVRLLRVLWPGEELAHRRPSCQGSGRALDNTRDLKCPCSCREPESHQETRTIHRGGGPRYAMCVCMNAPKCASVSLPSQFDEHWLGTSNLSGRRRRWPRGLYNAPCMYAYSALCGAQDAVGPPTVDSAVDREESVWSHSGVGLDTGVCCGVGGPCARIPLPEPHVALTP